MAKTKESLPSNDRLGKIVCIDKNDLTQSITELTANVKRKSDYLPEILKEAKAAGPKEPEWSKAVCPICGKEYPYLPGHNPGYCERFNCLYKLAIEALEKRGKS